MRTNEKVTVESYSTLHRHHLHLQNALRSTSNDSSCNESNDSDAPCSSSSKPMTIQIETATATPPSHASSECHVAATRTPVLSPQRRVTELLVPDAVRRIRSSFHIDTNANTISLSRDIFTAIIVLKAYRVWPELPYRHRRQLLILACICILLQFGLLLSLSIEMVVTPPWRQQDDYYHYVADGHYTANDGKSILIIVTKFWCLVAVLIYLFKELHEVKAYRKLRLELQDFRSSCSNSLFVIYTVYHLSLYLMAMALSVVLISTSSNGFDAVLNAVAILFVLEIDNWMHSMIKSNQYIDEQMFEIKYEKHKEMTSYLIAKYKYYSDCCICCCVESTHYKHKAEGNESFISLVTLFVWFALIISMSLLCLGQVYDDWLLLWSGYVLLAVVTVYYAIRHTFNVIGACCFRCKNRNKINEFRDEQLPRICHKYIKEMDRKLKMNKSKKSRTVNAIKDEFVEECFAYFENNVCGAKETESQLTEKFLFAFDEYYNKCDKSRIQHSDIDFGAIALGINFRL